ncbi:hypothetical protein NW762_011139 [Fusarium torreyae]|uniref:Uncharacterized protein n=1 Tax=Fusarium torreyae TaxID=1237075 RepID=A0A9W8RPT5_9HYPO|nr:hypothetical protein NW762_011139 [Fusarium torreyae]
MLDEISTLATECLGLFQLSLQKSPESPRSDANDLDLKNLKKLADEHTRFSQWVVAASALEKGPESLEYRLKDASHIRLRIINLIQRVEQLLRDLLNIMQGDSTPWDQLSSEEDSSCDEISRESPGSELAQTVLHISRSVEDLLDLKIAIRDPAPHDMMIRDQFSWPLSFELEDNTPYLQDEYPTIDRDLARRLNAAVSARRRYFKYRQAIDSDETIVGKLSIQDEVAVSASEPHKTSDKLVGGAQAADTDFDTSDTTTAAGEIKLPPLPKPARSGNAFTCPYCRIMMRISSVTEWR